MPELPEVTLTVMSKRGPAQTTHVDVREYLAQLPENRQMYLHLKCLQALRAAMQTFPDYTAIKLGIRRRDE